jgi:hypothetical protein
MDNTIHYITLKKPLMPAISGEFVDYLGPYSDNRGFQYGEIYEAREFYFNNQSYDIWRVKNFTGSFNYDKKYWIDVTRKLKLKRILKENI